MISILDTKSSLLCLINSNFCTSSLDKSQRELYCIQQLKLSTFPAMSVLCIKALELCSLDTCVQISILIPQERICVYHPARATSYDTAR